MIASPIARGFITPAAGGLVLPVLTNLLMYIDVNAPNSIWQDTARTIPATATDELVLGITDFSGTNNHWSQTSTGAAPSVKFIGNNKVLTFQNGTDYMLFTSGLSTIRTGFFVLGEQNGWTGGYSFFLGHSSVYNFHSETPHGCFSSTYSTVNALRIDKAPKNIFDPRPISPAIKVVSLTTSTNSNATEFSRDRLNNYGNRSWWGDFAMVALYSVVLTAQQISDTEDAIKAYLSI